MVSFWTELRTRGASIARDIMEGAVFIKDAEIMILFKCVPPRSNEKHSNELTNPLNQFTSCTCHWSCIQQCTPQHGTWGGSPQSVPCICTAGGILGLGIWHHERCMINSKTLCKSVFLQFLPTDAIRADGITGRSWSCAILKSQAERLTRLPWPPVALVQLATEWVAVLSVLLLAEVNGVFLWDMGVIYGPYYMANHIDIKWDHDCMLQMIKVRYSLPGIVQKHSIDVAQKYSYPSHPYHRTLLDIGPSQPTQ